MHLVRQRAGWLVGRRAPASSPSTAAALAPTATTFAALCTAATATAARLPFPLRTPVAVCRIVARDGRCAVLPSHATAAAAPAGVHPPR